MEKILWVVLAVVLFAWAMSESKATEPDLTPVDIQRFHDDEAQVTCWVILNGTKGEAISCLPNSVVAPEGRDEK